MLASKLPKRHRRQNGNMLILACVLMTLVALAITVALSYSGIFFAHNRLQTSADEIALAGARKLNEFNRLGQMNDMIARSRQLVYFSSEQHDDVTGPGNDPLMEKFSRQLLEEAKESARDLERERQYLSTLVQDESRAEMEKKFKELKESYAMTLPWLTITTPRVLSVNSGSFAKMESNAQELEGLAELVEEDRKNTNVVDAKPINLYRAENDAKLPSVDPELHFRFSPLAAPVGNDMSPARIVLAEKFKTSKPNYAPCATNVKLALGVKSGLGSNASATFEVSSAAVATGGGLWQ